MKMTASKIGPISAFAAAFALLTLGAAPALAQNEDTATEEAAQEEEEEIDDDAPVFTTSDKPYPFSEAVRVDDILYMSGQIGTTEDGDTLVPGGIGPETRAMMEGIGATLAKHDLGWSDVFKCTVFLADMDEWGEFNAVYRTYFEEGRFPARSALGANGLALGSAVEMECLAYAPSD